MESPWTKAAMLMANRLTMSMGTQSMQTLMGLLWRTLMGSPWMTWMVCLWTTSMGPPLAKMLTVLL